MIEAVINHPPELTEAIAGYLFEHTSSAVLTNDHEGITTTCVVYQSEDYTLKSEKDLKQFLFKLAEIFNLSSPPEASWTEVTYGDWAEKWKEGLEPIILDKLIIKPSWSDLPEETGKTVIELDPGLAFGTGHHATTLFCLEEVERFFEDPKNIPARVLDVGTGSGILAMAAAALGTGEVIAFDIDPEVMPVAMENLAINGLTERVELKLSGPEDIKGKFDLILANLTMNPLIKFAGLLVDMMEASAELVLSGVLETQAEEVMAAYREKGLELLEFRVSGEWCCLRLAKKYDPV